MSDENLTNINPSTFESSPENLESVKKDLNRDNKKKHIRIVAVVLVVVVLIACGTYFFIVYRNREFYSPIGGTAGESALLENPLSGELVARKDGESWVNERPLGVMINNHMDARPQSGLIYADLVYEVVAEGGITRLLPFYMSKIPEKIGPVRSTREYYLVLVKELGDAMLMHIGWSPQALEAIETWPVRSLARGGATFWRDNSRGVATEHTAYVDGKHLRELSLDLGWEGVGEFDKWKYKDDLSGYEGMSASSEVSIDFWHRGDYSAVFRYDGVTNSYLRYMGYNSDNQPIPHKDQETEEQILVKNLIVQFVMETPIPGDAKNRLEYGLIGSGSGLVFTDGKVIDVTWNKESRDSRTIFYDQDGNEMQYNRGKFWISVVPDRNIDQVVYN